MGIQPEKDNQSPNDGLIIIPATYIISDKERQEQHRNVLDKFVKELIAPVESLCKKAVDQAECATASRVKLLQMISDLTSTNLDALRQEIHQLHYKNTGVETFRVDEGETFFDDTLMQDDTLKGYLPTIQGFDAEKDNLTEYLAEFIKQITKFYEDYENNFKDPQKPDENPAKEKIAKAKKIAEVADNRLILSEVYNVYAANMRKVISALDQEIADLEKYRTDQGALIESDINKAQNNFPNSSKELRLNQEKGLNVQQIKFDKLQRDLRAILTVQNQNHQDLALQHLRDAFEEHEAPTIGIAKQIHITAQKANESIMSDANFELKFFVSDRLRNSPVVSYKGIVYHIDYDEDTPFWDTQDWVKEKIQSLTGFPLTNSFANLELNTYYSCSYIVKERLNTSLFGKFINSIRELVRPSLHIELPGKTGTKPVTDANFDYFVELSEPVRARLTEAETHKLQQELERDHATQVTTITYYAEAEEAPPQHNQGGLFQWVGDRLNDIRQNLPAVMGGGKRKNG